MEFETILNAMEAANDWAWKYPPSKMHPHAERQYNTFRARILRMDAEKDRCKRALSDIHSLGYDYDGYAGSAKELEILIDEFCTISTKALAGEEWWETEVTK